MLTMKDLPYPAIGEEIKYTLAQDTLLDDKAFSNKPNQIARTGETITLRTYANYGVAQHKVFGLFRY